MPVSLLTRWKCSFSYVPASLVVFSVGYLVSTTFHHKGWVSFYRETVCQLSPSGQLLSILPCLGPGPREFCPVLLPPHPREEGEGEWEDGKPGCAAWHVYMRDGHEGIITVRLWRDCDCLVALERWWDKPVQLVVQTAGSKLEEKFLSLTGFRASWFIGSTVQMWAWKSNGWSFCVTKHKLERKLERRRLQGPTLLHRIRSLLLRKTTTARRHVGPIGLKNLIDFSCRGLPLNDSLRWMTERNFPKVLQCSFPPLLLPR